MLYNALKIVLALMFGSFLLGSLAGCQTAKGNFVADDATMSSQFELAWGTSVRIGFPGTLKGKGSVEGSHESKPAPIEVD